MTAIDTFITVAILIFVILFIYSKIKKQTIVDTANEIKFAVSAIFSPIPYMVEEVARPI